MSFGPSRSYQMPPVATLATADGAVGGAPSLQPIRQKLVEVTRYDYKRLRRKRRKLAKEKCDPCRKAKQKCLPKNPKECERCCKRRLDCPGPTKAKRSAKRSTSVDSSATTSSAATHHSELRHDGCDDESPPVTCACSAQYSCSHRLPKTFRLNEICLDGTSETRYILADRSSLPWELAQMTCDQCLSDGRRMPRTVFEVAVSQQQLDIVIHSQDLHSDLKSLFLIDLGGVNETFDGKSLLKHYTALTTRLDDLRSSDDVLKTTGDLIEEWQLLVEGFLGNLSVFRLFGFQELCDYEVLDNRLRKAFAQQELEYGIDLFHQKFIEIDDHDKTFRYAMSGWPPLDPVRLLSQEEIIAQPEYRKNSYIITFHQGNDWRSEWPCSEKDKLLEMINEDSRRAKERLPRFRFRFIYQYRLLEKATASQDPSTTLSQLAGQLQGYKQAFNAAMRTMRRLSRLTPPESLLDTLCFLSVARAVAETDEDGGNVCISAFTQDLEQWIQIFPEIEEAARLMWGITFDLVPQPQSTARQLCHNSMLQLRDSVAALIGMANELFDLGAQSRHDEMHVLSAFHQQRQRNNDQTSPTVEPSDSPITARAKEPPDRRICPITSLQEKVQGNPRFNRVVVILVTSIIFALVVYFMLGFAHILSATVLGLPNPWYTGMAQTTSTCRSTPSATFFTGYEQASGQEFDSATDAAQPASNPVQATILFDDIFDYEKFSADSATGKGLFGEAEKL